MKNPASKGLTVEDINNYVAGIWKQGASPDPVLERRGLDMYLNGVLVARGIRQNADLGEELYGRGLDYDDEMKSAWEGWQ